VDLGVETWPPTCAPRGADEEARRRRLVDPKTLQAPSRRGRWLAKPTAATRPQRRVRRGERDRLAENTEPILASPTTRRRGSTRGRGTKVDTCSWHVHDHTATSAPPASSGGASGTRPGAHLAVPAHPHGPQQLKEESIFSVTARRALIETAVLAVHGQPGARPDGRRLLDLDAQLRQTACKGAKVFQGSAELGALARGPGQVPPPPSTTRRSGEIEPARASQTATCSSDELAEYGSSRVSVGPGASSPAERVTAALSLPARPFGGDAPVTER
jgi:hypothetical protein